MAWTRKNGLPVYNGESSTKRNSGISAKFQFRIPLTAKECLNNTVSKSNLFFVVVTSIKTASNGYEVFHRKMWCNLSWDLEEGVMTPPPGISTNEECNSGIECMFDNCWTQTKPHNTMHSVQGHQRHILNLQLQAIPQTQTSPWISYRGKLLVVTPSLQFGTWVK